MINKKANITKFISICLFSFLLGVFKRQNYIKQYLSRYIVGFTTFVDTYIMMMLQKEGKGVVSCRNNVSISYWN